MSNDKKVRPFSELLLKAFVSLEEVKTEKPDDSLDGEHLRIKTLGMWADDDYPEDFLEKYIARYAEHFSKCETCQKNVAFYRTQRHAKNPVLKF